MKEIMRMDIHDIFNKVLKYIINILIFYIIAILILSLGKTLYTMKIILNGEEIGGNLSHAVTDILSFLVLIELFRSFIEYFRAKRIRLHTMIDPAIIFIVRELIVLLYRQSKLVNTELIGFGILLLCLGVIRSLAIVYSPKENILK